MLEGDDGDNGLETKMQDSDAVPRPGHGDAGEGGSGCISEPDDCCFVPCIVEAGEETRTEQDCNFIEPGVSAASTYDCSNACDW